MRYPVFELMGRGRGWEGEAPTCWQTHLQIIVPVTNNFQPIQTLCRPTIQQRDRRSPQRKRHRNEIKQATGVFRI